MCFVSLLGCIECMSCRLLLPVFLSVGLSRGFTQLWRAKTAERIEVQFGVKTFAGPRNIVLADGPDSPVARGREKRIQYSLCQITLASCLHLRTLTMYPLFVSGGFVQVVLYE